MHYVAALYDHLVHCNRIDPADDLPLVLPIAILNARWKHSTDVFDMIQPHPAILSEIAR